MTTREEIRSNALDTLAYLAACERGDTADVDAFLSTVNTADDLWNLVTALSGYCVGILRVSSSMIGQDPGKMLAVLAADIRESR